MLQYYAKSLARKNIFELTYFVSSVTKNVNPINQAALIVTPAVSFIALNLASSSAALVGCHL